MKLTIARAASALAVAALAVTAAAAPAAASVEGITVDYQGVGQGYLLELWATPSVWASGGPVTGEVQIAQPCAEPDGSTGVAPAGTFTVTGTYNPRGVDAYGDQLSLTGPIANIGGTPEEVIGDLTTPVTGNFSDGALVLDDSEAWTGITQTSQFYSMVEGIGPVLAYCS
jgi:hypothetical protein